MIVEKDQTDHPAYIGHTSRKIIENQHGYLFTARRNASVVYPVALYLSIYPQQPMERQISDAKDVDR